MFPGGLQRQYRSLPAQVGVRPDLRQKGVRALDMQHDGNSEQLLDVPPGRHGGVQVSDQRRQLAANLLIIAVTFRRC